MDATEGNDGRLIVSEEEVPEHLRISSSDLHIEDFIGYGSSSAVYKATWLGCKVAVKDILNFGSFKPYRKELEILMRLPHPHVVQLLGFCIEGNPLQPDLSIVMERLETSLSKIIYDRLTASGRRRPFDFSEAIDILMKIALGMKFLHSREIVHGGLSTDIILMNVYGEEDFDVKIGGFAFSDYASSNSPTASFQPQYIYHTFPAKTIAGDHSPLKVTKAVDVFVFGMICYAVLTGHEVRHPNRNFAVDNIFWEVVSGQRPELIPSDVDHDLMELILKCCDAEAEHRLSFSVICDTLAEIRTARGQFLQKKTTETEVSGSQRWTTNDDDNDTCVEIATILKTLPNHLSIDYADVEWRRPIGEGSYAKVYEVNWLGCSFAVKRFKLLSASLKEEIEFLTKLQHPHIARLIGLSVDSNGGWIMMERMETDLQKLMHSRASSPPFSDSEARELCFKIALGLNFLHSKNVVHRDIKSANVLVHNHHGRFDVKITDFGVSHRIGNSSVANYAGTGLWRAPEILKAKRDKPLTEDQLKKTDVYSFGMTSYEIVTGHVLHEHLSADDVIAKHRPKLPRALGADLRDLISKCWDDDPKVRPDFSTICLVLSRTPNSQTQVVPRSRSRKIVEFLKSRLLVPFRKSLRWRAVKTEFRTIDLQLES